MSFAVNLAQELGVPHNGPWIPSVMRVDEAVASISRLNGCSEEKVKQVLASLEPYTQDPRCNSIFYGAIAANSVAMDKGDNTRLENTCFVDLQNPANNTWSFADISGDLSAVYCNGFLVGLIGIAPSGVDLEAYSQSVIPNIPNWLYGFMGFVNLIAEDEDGSVNMNLGLVDASGADLEWYEFDTTQTAYLVAKSLFVSGAVFNSIFYRAAMYGNVVINGTTFENNDKIAEVLIHLIDSDASGVIDVTPAEEEHEEVEDDEASIDEEEAEPLYDEDEDEGEDDDIDFDSAEDLEGEKLDLEADEIDFDEAEDLEGEEIDFDEAEDLELDSEVDEDLEDEEIELDETEDLEFEEADESFIGDDFDSLDFEADEESEEADEEADEEIEEEPYQPKAVSLGREDLTNVLRRVLGASNSLIKLIIGEVADTEITSETPVNVDAICHVLAAEFYPDEVIQSFLLLADQYAVEDSTISCGDAVEAVANAIWGDIPEYSRERVEEHAANILIRHRDALWLGVYHTDAVIERLNVLGYNDAVCLRVATLMEAVKEDIDTMRKKLIRNN